jgi:mannan endo-1,4-beta-mannosidase
MGKLVLFPVIIFNIFMVSCANKNEKQTKYESLDGQKIYYAKDTVLNDVLIYYNDQNRFGRKDYAGNFSKDDSSITFFVDVPISNHYDIIISSAAGYGNGYKINTILVEGQQIGEIKTLENNQFDENEIKYVYLEKGVNEITIKKYWGWFFVDYLYICESKDLPGIAYNISNNLINPYASEKTKRLMNYICEIYGKQTLSGQSGSGINSNEFKAIYSVTGKYPAVMMLDMIDYSPSRVAYGTRGTSIEEAIEWHNMGGIVKYLWHWNAPNDLIDTEENRWWSGFYTRATTFNLEKVMSKEDIEGYNLLLHDIDVISGHLKRLNDLDIPVLWRPLHEASGGWFWWGAFGPEVFKKLWILMYDRMTNHHQLNNIIWVWNGGEKEWFPGAEYVDLVGEDIYPSARGYSSLASKFYEIVEYLHELGAMKPIGLTECGTLPDINKMERDKSMWFMFAAWNSEYVNKKNDRFTSEYSEEYTEISHLRMMYNDRRVVTLNDLPDLKEYTLNISH